MWFFLVVYANKNKVFMLCLMKFPLIFMLCFSLFPQGKLKVGLAPKKHRFHADFFIYDDL